MMISNISVNAIKAEKYINTLSKHFARKVAVHNDSNVSIVHFSMGICKMSFEGTTMKFSCSAETVNELEIVKKIVSDHVQNLGELRGSTLNWVDG